jgi:predicted nucleic acid-binding protein
MCLMTQNGNAIQVLSFSGSKDECPTWREKFIAKAKCSGIKDVFLEGVLIPKSSEVFDEKTEEGKRMLRIIDLNDMAFTKLILSIDVSSSSGKIAVGIFKSYKTKDYEDGHACLDWENLKRNMT